ncbi:MAG: hypothetical protein QXG86_03035 [Candidatus Woesearchaeota archaeon]
MILDNILNKIKQKKSGAQRKRGNKQKIKNKKEKKLALTKQKKEKTQKIGEEIKEKTEEIDRSIWPIKVTAVIEILGAPEDYVKQTMHSYLEKLKNEKDLKTKILFISPAEPKEKLFSIYSEVELLAKKPSRIVDFCFDYMPSSVELIEPPNITFDAHSFSNFFNDLQARLHNLDMLVKNLTAENKLLNQNAHLILRNNILLSLKEKDKDLKTISKNIGIPEEKTKIFLDALVQKGFIIFKKGKYSLNREKVTFSE